MRSRASKSTHQTHRLLDIVHTKQMIETPLTPTENGCKWNGLPQIPVSIFSKPIFINPNEFVIITFEKSNNHSIIYSFNIHCKQWTQILYQKIGFRFIPNSIAYDIHNHILYTNRVDDYLKAKMIKVDLKTQEINIVEEIDNIRESQKLLHLNHHLYLIGNISFEYNTMQNILRKEMEFNKDSNIVDSNYGDVIYLNSMQSILLFGAGRQSRDIYIFSLKSKRCSKLKTKSPAELRKFGIVKTESEQYIIILGGQAINQSMMHVSEGSDSIFIFDTIKRKFMKSAIKTPSKGYFYAVINNISDQQLINGFIRNSMNGNIECFPLALIELILEFFYEEMIFLLQYCASPNSSSTMHWNISVQEILDNIIRMFN
eukprot:439642_1